MTERLKITDIEELMEILDISQNSIEGIDVSKVNVNSSTVLNWKCQKGHTFREQVKLLYNRKHKCYYCSGRKVWTGENDLLTLYPELACEFDVQKNGISPDKVSPRDTSVYWWTCKNAHPSFQQSVEHRVTRQTKCPYCTERRVLRGYNDLKTLYPDIALEWDEEKNNDSSPEDVFAYSYQAVWWKCPKGHSYKKKIVQRTKFHKPVDCTKCIKARSTSFPEQVVYYYVKKCFPDAINRYKEPFDNGMELDIYIPFYRMGIEYDGIAFHNDREQHERELRKYLQCKELGIKLVRIKEAEDSWRDTADTLFFVNKRMKDSQLSAFLRFMFGQLFVMKLYTFQSEDKDANILNRRYGFPTDFDVSRDRPEIMEYLVDVDHSFGEKHPNLAAMWDKDKNGTLTPYMFTSGSNYMAHWNCPLCGNSWASPIASIVSRRVKSCRKCSDREKGLAITKGKTSLQGSLAERSEIMLKQWDFESNGSLSPYEVPLCYSFEVAWKCDECGYKWSSSPNSRVRGKNISGCPHCTGRVAMSGVDDLATLYPKIAKEWDFDKNIGILPSQIKPHSNKKYYWLCSFCGFSYSSVLGSRVNGHGCPECARRKVGIKNSKSVGQFDETGMLIATFQSLHEAASVMSVGTNAIFQAVKYGRKSKGYYWRYIEPCNSDK